MKTVCFIGHRNCKLTAKQTQYLLDIVTSLIIDGADTFLFGSRSSFDDVCWEIVSELKSVFSNIKRIYVRAEFPYASEAYLND